MRSVRGWLKPAGVFIVVLGPDGSGKSTLIEYLVRETGSVFSQTRLFHWRPRMIAGTSSGGPVTDPHGAPARGALLSVAFSCALIADYWLSYCLLIRPLLVHSGLVIFDRYFDDVVVDPKRYRYGGPLWISRMMTFLIPRPDLTFILDAAPEIVLLRKQEVTAEEVARQREEYLLLARTKRNAHLLDASLPVRTIGENAAGIIRSHLDNSDGPRPLSVAPVPAATGRFECREHEKTKR